jgi:fibronectin type 3 domain-containing protein
VKVVYGGWAGRPLGRTGRHGAAWWRALAGTCLAATVAGMASLVLAPGTALAAPAATAPPNNAPTHVAAMAGDSSVTLTWQAPAPPSSPPVSSPAGSPVRLRAATNVSPVYYVYVGTGPGGESKTPVNTTPTAGLSYTVPELTNGTTYYFTVATAIGERVLENATSAEVSATPATTPGAPTGLTVQAAGSQATLSWTAPASDGGSPVTGYRVYEGNTADFTDGAPATTATGTGAVITGLDSSATYYFRVTAVNAAGQGTPSGEAILPADTVPGPPTGLTAKPSGSQVTLSWTAPASDGGAKLTGYVIDEGTSPDRAPGTPVAGSPVNATSYTVTGLTKGSTYYFTVAAVNAAGQGPASAKVAATLPEAPRAFTAPNGLTATPGNAQVQLSWTAPASDGGSRITGYKLYRATAPGVQASAVITSVTGTSTTVTGLSNGSTYYFRVAAINAAGNQSPSSPEVSAKPGRTVPVNPTSVPEPLIAVLAAIATVALAAALTLAMRGRRPDSREPDHGTPALDVHAVPGPRLPDAVNVRETGTERTHTVRFEPDRGTTTTTIKEKP